MVWNCLISRFYPEYTSQKPEFNILTRIGYRFGKKREKKKKLLDVLYAEGILLCQRTRLDLIIIIILLKILISRHNKLVLSPITCFTCNRI